ncbi:hypothetical protein [Myxosarcina sp. GI1]|uniref:hypothetical protein n=1 Tax=Myxosarcina sp. GI1 TaxID=1541065 RepID=UPI00209F5BA3|nr:hypothetical protein [Myxosarcina sp. GI1]
MITYKPLGEILQDAGLVTDSQIKVALFDQKNYQDLRVGEILAMRGWIEQTTADFFGEQWLDFVNQQQKHPLGYYLKQAGLLTEEDIKLILCEQKKIALRFGSTAVMKGLLKQQTIDFFLKSLFPQANSFNSSIETSKPKERQTDDLITKDDITYWATLSARHLLRA